MKTLHIAVADKKAIYRERDGEIVCGNSDYVIEFAFDSEWSAHATRTARFVWSGQYRDVVFTGYTCPVPTLNDTTSVSVGVYAGNLCTTTPAIISCKRSILCGSDLPSDPPDSVYTQILEKMDESTIPGDSVYVRYSANADGTDFTDTWSVGQTYVGFATASSAPTNKENYTWCLFAAPFATEVTF